MPTGVYKRPEFCKRGHARTPENVNRRKGCIRCCSIKSRQWRLNNRDKANALARNWRARNPECVKQWNANHRDKCRAASRKYYASHKGELTKRNYKRNYNIGEQQRLWRVNNPEKVRLGKRRWVAKNKEQQLAYTRYWQKFGTSKIPEEVKEAYELYRQLKREARNGFKDSKRFEVNVNLGNAEGDGRQEYASQS